MQKIMRQTVRTLCYDLYFIIALSVFVASGVSSRLQALQSQLLQVQVEKNEMIQKGKEADQQIEFLGSVIQDLQVTKPYSMSMISLSQRQS